MILPGWWIPPGFNVRAHYLEPAGSGATLCGAWKYRDDGRRLDGAPEVGAACRRCAVSAAATRRNAKIHRATSRPEPG